MASRTEAAVAMVQRRVFAIEVPCPLLTSTRLYRTGELADLVVQSDTRAFRAHRDIVFELVPVLQESCIVTPEVGSTLRPQSHPNSLFSRARCPSWFAFLHQKQSWKSFFGICIS